MAGTAFADKSSSGSIKASSFGGFGDPNQQELNRLQRRIQELEQLIHEKQGSMDDVSGKLKKSYDDNTKKMAADFRKSYEKFASDCIHSYNENISILNNDYQNRISALQCQYEKLKKETDKLEKELRNSYNELEKKMNRLCRNDKAYCDHARSAIERLERGLADTQATLPVECFFPHKIDIYSEELVRSRELFSRELYSISESAANSAYLGLERLRNDTERELHRLMSLVNRYRCLLEAAEEFAASDTVHTFRTQKGETVHMEDHALGYWSDGTFDIIMNEMKMHHENIEKISGEDAVKSLRFRREEELFDFFSKQIENVRHFPEIIYLTAEFACRAYLNSVRINNDLNDAIVKMKRQNFILKSVKYGPCRAPQTKSFWRFMDEHLKLLECTDPIGLPDMREEIRLVFTREYSCSQNSDEFVVTVMPVRKGTDITARTTCEFKGCKSDKALTAFLTGIFNQLMAVNVPYGSRKMPDPHKVLTRTEAEELAAQRIFG